MPFTMKKSFWHSLEEIGPDEVTPVLPIGTTGFDPVLPAASVVEGLLELPPVEEDEVCTKDPSDLGSVHL